MAPRQIMRDETHNIHEGQEHRISLPSQLYWRSTLGSPAAWSGSSSRGVYLMDDVNNNGSSSLIQNIIIDKRMLRLPSSLRDVVVQNLLSTDDRTPNYRHNRRGNMQSTRRVHNQSKSNIQLLCHPRIVGSSQSSIGSSTFFSSTNNNRANNGIACMDIDNGNDDTMTGSPSRYLLVGSSGGDCTIAMYDLSYFGSDGYLYQQQQSTSNNYNNSISSQSSTSISNLASVTHRPIAKSIRHQSSTTSIKEDASAVPSGHKHPLLGCKWYPGDAKQMFVSASISGEILIWDVSNFVPVFATYAHIYTGISRGNNNDENDGGKTVAPLQCMDLPKSPESCPNGNALLALGLGSSGRGVIQLCDAFRGGSATHELVGHGNGGVNTVLWDSYHPFRLASGGDDCTIRLWDIRKAGSAACLGILNRENEMFSGVGDVSVNDDDYSTAIRKKQRASLSTVNNIRTASGIESHGTPVTALAFAPGGDDLVSTGLDGKIQHWDLRPDSCFVSSMDAITSGKNSCDPSVATGGRLYPTSFTDGSSNNNRTGLHNKASSKRRRSYHFNKPSLAIVQPGSRSTTTLISTSSSNNGASRGQITGYSLFGKRGKEPGCCDFTLNGHLSDVTCLLPITTTWDNLAVNSRSTNTNHTVSFLTGGLDGMVLSWGSSRRRQYTVSSTDSTHENDISFNNIPYSSPVHHAEQPSEDLDNW